jgi:hypothetical protein
MQSLVNSSRKEMRGQVVRLWLRETVHCVRVGEALLFLDLEAGSYRAVVESPEMRVRALSSAAATDGAIDQLEFGVDDTTQLDELIQVGLLTGTAPRARRSTPVQVSRLLLPQDNPLAARKPALLHSALSFARAFAFVALRRRHLDLGRQSARLRQRKARASRQTAATDIGQLRALMRHFYDLRTLVYSADKHCLFDSLIVSHYLLGLHIQPTFVVGVRTRPFGGHCWVQHGDYVINDSPDRVQGYTPILSI